MTMLLELDLPDNWARLHLPQALADRLQFLLDRQDSGQLWTSEEHNEAEGLVEVSEFLSLLRLRKQRLAP